MNPTASTEDTVAATARPEPTAATTPVSDSNTQPVRHGTLHTFARRIFDSRFVYLFKLELAIWYYVLASWHRRPNIPTGSTAFTYHKDNGFMALSSVILGLAPVETFAVHLLIMQWSPAAAIILTLFSVYILIWMIGLMRAVVLNPILVDNQSVTLRWSTTFCEQVPFSLIECISNTEPDIPKLERMDLGMMGADPCWIILRETVSMRSQTGKRRHIRTVNVSPDDPVAFTRALMHGIAHSATPAPTDATTHATAAMPEC